MKGCDILNSKLAAPTVGNSIDRERLIPHFNSITDHRITVVTAGAGYGKSTFVAQACAYHNASRVWYRIENSDRDPVNFISYIVAGLRKIIPEFGKSVLERLDASVGSGITQPVLDALVTSLESEITGTTLIILDDVHIIHDSEEIQKILQFLLNHLPAAVHCVMMSRTDLLIPLSQFRARLELYEVDHEILAFSGKEIVALYSQLFGYDIPEMNLLNLEGKTEGWVSGLILFYHLSRGKSQKETEELLESIQGSHKIFRDYMGENVFELLAPDVREFLLKTSVFNQMDTDICNRFLEITNSDDYFADLEKKKLFTQALDDDRTSYSYHHLFLEFLRTRLAEEFGESFVFSLHTKAAYLFEESDNIDAALNHFLNACEYDHVFRVLAEKGRIMLSQGRHKTLDNIFASIPEQYHYSEPWIPALKSMMFTSVGELNQAVRYNGIARDLFEKQGQNEHAETLMMELSRILYLIGDFNRAERVSEAIINSDTISVHNRLEALGHLIFITASQGNIEQSDIYYHEAESELKRIKKDSFYTELMIWITLNYAFSYYHRGEFFKAVRLADSILSEIRQSGSLMLMGYYCHVVGISYFMSGKFDEARNITDSGIAMLRKSGFQGSQEAWLLMSYASICMLSGEHSKVDPALAKGKNIFRRGGSRWGEASMLVIETIYAANSGNVEKAVQCVDEGLSIAGELDIPWVKGKLYSFSALSLIRGGDLQSASSMLDMAEEILNYSIFEICQINLLRSVYYSMTGESEKARELTIYSLKLGQANRYGPWIFFSVVECVPLIVDVYASGIHTNYIKKIFMEHGYRFSDELQQIHRNGDKRIKKAALEILRALPKTRVPSLSVSCLGKFRVVVGGREIESSDWKSTKARDIFKYLILSRKKGPVNKEVLMELIWPEEDSEKTQKRLHVALPALRKTLEPDVKRGASSYLVRDKETYSINIGDQGVVDLEQFVKASALAREETDSRKKLVFLLEAESYYTGELYADDPYAEWCFEEREQLNRIYLKVLDAITDIYESVNDTERCIDYTAKYIKSDPYAESMYLKLMRLYYDAGNQAMVVRTWEKCRKNIEEDLGCPLSDEIIEFHERFVKT